MKRNRRKIWRSKDFYKRNDCLDIEEYLLMQAFNYARLKYTYDGRGLPQELETIN